MSTLLTAARPALSDLSEQERMFQEAVRDFATAEIAPKVMEMDEAATMDLALLPQLFEMGLMGIEIPEQYGGTGADFFTSILVVEELSRVDPAISVLVDVQNTLVINAMIRWGSDDLNGRYLPRLASDTVGAYALSEADSGSDAFGLRCRAEKKGDDWVLDGRKLWITNAAEAGMVVSVESFVGSDRGGPGVKLEQMYVIGDEATTALSSYPYEEELLA